MYAGHSAGAKARRAGHAILARVDRLLAERGEACLSETSVEIIGTEDTYGPAVRRDDAREVVLKLAARDPRADALQLLAREFAPAALSMAPGMSGLTGGRPRVAPAIGVASLLVAKHRVAVRVVLDGSALPVAVACGHPGAGAGTPALPSRTDAPPYGGQVVPLHRVADARSGDKGNAANIGVIARTPDLLPLIREQVTPERVRAFFAHYLGGQVRGWELPGLAALNFLLEDVLGGAGGTTSLRFDPQGKSYAAMLLDLPVMVPAGTLLPDLPGPA
jgi:hypothetical protein